MAESSKVNLKASKETRDMLSDMNKLAGKLAKNMGIVESASTATTKELEKSNKVVQDKFRNLTETLKLSKKENEYQKAARKLGSDILKLSGDDAKFNKQKMQFQQKQLIAMGKIDDIAKDLTEQFGMQASAIKNAVKQGKLLLNPFIMLSGFLALSIKRFFELEKLGKGTARQSGLLERNTKEFQKSIKEVQPELIAFGASVEDISKASGTAADNFGFLDEETSKIVKNSVMIGTAFGIQADTMVEVVSQARLLGASMEDIDAFTNDVIGSGIQVNKVFEDLKAVQGDTATILAGQTNQLMSQVLEARKLGLNLNDIANAQSATSGFQDMFTKGMKASVLFGRSIDLVESTRLRRQGKFLEARESELAALTGTRNIAQQALAIENMTLEQKKSLEEITGRTAADTIKDLNRQLFLQGKLSGQAALDVQNEIQREKLLQKQLNIQDKLRAIFTRIGITLGEKLLPFIEKFAASLEALVSDPTRLTKAINNIGNAITILAGSFAALKTVMFGLQMKQMFGALGPVGGGGGGASMFQNLFAGTEGRASLLGGRGQKRTMSGALNRSAGRMNAIGGAAKFARVLGPAAAAISLGADVFKMATTKDARARKDAQGSLAGGVIGGGIGFLLGGPAGAAIGAGLGQFAGKAVAKYFETEEEELSRAARTATANIQRDIALSVRSRKNEITSSLADALKGINYDQVVDKISSSLKIDEKAAQGLLDQTGMTAEGFAKLDDKGLSVFVESLVAASGVVDNYAKNLKTLADQAATEAGLEEAKQVVSFVQGIKSDLGTESEDANRMLVEKFIQSADASFFKTLQGQEGFAKLSADALMEKFETQMEKTSLKGKTFKQMDELMVQQGQNFFKELLTAQLGADTFRELAGGDIDKFLESNIDKRAMRGFSASGDYEDEELGEIASSLLNQLLVSAQKGQSRASLAQREIFTKKKADMQDFTIRSAPADTITVQGGTQIGNDVVEKLDQVITAINNMGGDIIMDGKKVGRQIARGQQ